jgi:asparagine synthase (glutamine-hydrolysing)
VCGLIGVLRRGDGDCSGELSRALETIRHRGPDDRGTWSRVVGTASEPWALGLGHVRLSILDLSPAGHQPMADHAGNLIVFNGEVYNYLELRQQLSAAGHRFETYTDTEVVLAAYREWGDGCVERFIGMWVFAIWDGSELLLARDRLGKKPLYYYADRVCLAFCSEIKGLRQVSGVTWGPDERTLFRYLAFAELEDGGNTFFADIKAFPAGATARVRPGDPAVRPRKYWQLAGEASDMDEGEAVRQAERLLSDSLLLRLRSDAPLGLSLSGGLDSSLLLALMNQAGCARPRVFSTSYAEPGYSESGYLDLAIRESGCEPQLAVSSIEQFQRDFEAFIYHLGQPSKLPSPYSLWRVVDLASRHVKVLLDGQGADELAGGYMYFLPPAWREMAPRHRLRYLPDLLLTILANRHVVRQYNPSTIWERVRGSYRDDRIDYLCPHRLEAFRDQRPGWEGGGRFSVNDNLRRSVTDTSLPPLLRYSDHLTMAFGVENRCPFLDHRLVEFVASLPLETKIRGGTTKWLFRRMAAGKVPGAIVSRRMKMGFPTPVGVWLRNGLREQGRRWLEEYADNGVFSDWIDRDAALCILRAHVTGRQENQALLWRILSLGAWLKVNGL